MNNKITNNKVNYKKPLFIFCLMIIVFCLAGIYMYIYDEPGRLIVLLAILFYTLLIYFVITLIKIHKQNIKQERGQWINPEKNKIQQWKIFNKIIIPEYNLPNEVTPLIAWFLFDLKIWKEDIVCLIYKWMWEWIVSISYTKQWIKITKNGELQRKHTPSYEYDFRKFLFKDWETIQFPNEWINEHLNFIKQWIKKYCIEKWWINYKNIYSIFNFDIKWDSSKRNKFIPLWRLLWIILSITIIILCIFIASKLTFMEINKTWIEIFGVCIGLSIPLCLTLIFYFVISMIETNKKHTIKLTKKWKEIVYEIHWYKKFLEACEENQLKKFMEQDPLYIDKILPYAIALGLENNISNKIPQKIFKDKTKNLLLLEKVI